MNKMHTNQKATYEILGGWLMSNNEVNSESLADNIRMVLLDNTEEWYNEMRYNTRRKPRTVAVAALMAFINLELNEWNPGKNLYATNAQVMKFDREHGGSLEVVLDILQEYIEDERKEARA